MAPDARSSIARYGRLFGLLLVLVAFDVVAVAAAYVLGHVFFAIVTTMQFNPDMAAMILRFDVVPLVPFLLVGTPLTLVAQSVFGYRMTLRDIDTVPTEADGTDVAADDLTGRVAKLAHTAGMTPPDVRLVDSETPNSFVASRPGERTLFVTTALVEALDSDELDAVLAHELAHLDNGDSFVMTAAGFLPTVTTRFVERLFEDADDSPLFRRLRGEAVDWDFTAVAKSYNPLMVLLFLPAALPAAGGLYLASTACYRLLSRIREYAADAGGVAICGSPAAMASALETLTTDHRPDSDLRAAETGLRELCVLPYTIEPEPADGTDDPDRFDRIARRWNAVCTAVLPGSHPDPQDRIAALRERQASLERTG
ncbi:M48 family metallopeptidase [Haloarcula montana]|uniref:M48 family metallopeptidase n=1 Tax=Haloarcula montana TaxID=3111776 RepID=UPI002D77C36D|nr:M48 family metalloprotease [Haloarcula sp. GH36]